MPLGNDEQTGRNSGRLAKTTTVPASGRPGVTVDAAVGGSGTQAVTGSQTGRGNGVAPANTGPIALESGNRNPDVSASGVAPSPKIVQPNAGFGLTLDNPLAGESPTAVVNYDADGRVASLSWTPAPPRLTWRAKVLDQAFNLKTIRLLLSANVTAYRVMQGAGTDDGGFPLPPPASAPAIVVSPTAFPSPLLPSPVVSTSSRLVTESLQLTPGQLGLPTKLDAKSELTLSLSLDQAAFRDYLGKHKPVGSVDLTMSLVDDGGVAVPAGANPALFKGRFTIK
ncbi:MAG: hypothetical protein VKP62_15925 [Candidatus Sericytochromatia bacterium]|nr:hypothetical protein [Candidatus Sericytochromatia bacterium]